MPRSMNAARWARVQELFEAAAALASAARGALLDVECGDDLGLRREIEALIIAEQSAGDFLEVAVSTAARDAFAGSRAGERVGAWRLVREMGSGGMGSVFLAERADGQFDQRAAVKLIKRGMDSEQILSRFRAERQILAHLQHPDIARLLDGGMTEDGRPYFVMELVEGLPIDRYCSERGLDVDERLDLFQRVCRAVTHAHASLVVHRDLKPDNILVTEDGDVRLLDFGIGRLLADEREGGTRLTESGLKLMTPAYAAPEQVRGEPAGTSADVYSLGVVLYELLTGARPYEVQTRSPVEMERVICDTEPQRPSTRVLQGAPVGSVGLTSEGPRTGPASHSDRASAIARRRLHKRLKGDLDVICLKALRKEPERRYPSVEALLEDLRRHREGRPVEARADTAHYRLGKALRRHRVAVATAASILVGAGALVAFYTVRLTAERDLARLEAAKAVEVASFLRDLFEVADPSESRGATVTARELLDAGARGLETGLTDQPEVQAVMRRVIGDVYSGLGLDREARPLLEASLERLTALHGIGHEEVATTQIALGSVLQDLGDLTAAESLFRQALETRRRLLGTRHPAVSEALRHLAYYVETAGDDIAAERLYREALEMDRGLYSPGDVHIAAAQVRLGGLLRRTGRQEAAEPLMREGLAAQRAYYGSDHPDVASTVRNLAALLRDLGEYEESAALYEEALATRRALLGEDHPDVAVTLNSYALLLLRMGEIERGIVALEQFVSAVERTYDGPHASLAAAYHNLASAFVEAGRDAEAEASYLRSIDVSDRILPENHPDRARPLVALAELYVAEARYTDAEPLLLEAHGLLLESVGSEHRQSRGAREALVALYEAWDRPERAGAYAEATPGGP